MLKIAIIGLGPIGIAAARAVQRDEGFQLAGLVDSDPAKLGKRLVELDPHADADDVAVVGDIDQLPVTPDVAIVSTTSYFDRIAPTLRQLMRHKVHVVSSCEEMAWPWYGHPHLADVINGEANSAGVTLVGTGVNPGFVMDLLPVAMSSMLTRVERVTVTRVVDALTRRMPLQRKIGSTMSVDDFKKLAKQKQIGHMGLPESVVMLAQGLGRHPMRSEIRITLDPVIADRAIESLVGVVEPGQVCGMRNRGSYSAAGIDIELDLTMALAASEPRDEIEVVGEKTIRTIIPGSTPGDTATVAALVNVARALPSAPRGLRTMLDLPLCGCRSS
ncbi:MAG: dihydrodipicolinate reductase [Burkholderiales bacterium]|nr:dihydrodipicolinate reductase [Phycisphaerae bacterium]